jgi:hypothetical protein
MANRITTLFDLDAKGFDSGLKKLRTEVAKADGAVNKLKTAGSGLGTILQDNLANAAVAAGAALLAFGVKSVQAFQDTALAAGAFSDATGLAVDEASRFIEVAGDIGIEAGTVEAALGRMNKTLGGSPELFAELGVEIAKTGTGATDVNGTFLNVVDRLNAIEDPAERARVASQLLGKGWQGMAELIGQGSAELKASLAGVGDAQVIDPAELKKAREFRDRMDELNDRLGAVALTAGEAVVPKLAEAADAVMWITDKVSKLNVELKDGDESLGLFSSWGDALRYYKKQWNDVFGDETQSDLDDTTEATLSLDEAMGMVESRVSDADYSRLEGELRDISSGAQDTAEAMEQAEQAAAELDDAYSALIGKLDQQDAWDGFFEKMYVYHSETGRSAQETRDYTRDIAEMVMALEGVPPETKAQLIATLDAGNIAAVESRLNQLARNRVVSISGQLVGSGLRNEMEGRATGGPVTAGTPYLVGEKGPEIVVPGQSGTVIPNNRIGVGGGINVAIYPKTLPTDRELIDLVTNLRRRNGGVI